MSILRCYPDREETLLVVNARRVAVLIDDRVRKGTLAPLEVVERSLDAAMKARLEKWLADPPNRFYATHVPVDPQAGRSA